MNFFEEIYNLGDRTHISMTIMRIGEKLTVSALPVSSANIKALEVTGTPEELAEGFVREITAPMKEVIGIVSNAEQFKKSAEQAAETAKKEAETKKDTAAKQKPAQPSKPAKPKKEAKAAKIKPAKKNDAANKEASAEEPQEDDTSEGPTEMAMF